MKIIKNLIANVVICGALLFVFCHYEIGIHIEFADPKMKESIIGLVGAFLVLGFVFRIFNSPIKRILKTLSCPVNFLTLGLASIAINVLVFYMFAYAINNYLDLGLTVQLGQIWQTLILSFIMAIGIAILTKIL